MNPVREVEIKYNWAQYSKTIKTQRQRKNILGRQKRSQIIFKGATFRIKVGFKSKNENQKIMKQCLYQVSLTSAKRKEYHTGILYPAKQSSRNLSKTNTF